MYLQNITNIVDPPTNRRIKKLVRKGVLTNAHYQLKDPKDQQFALKITDHEFKTQFDEIKST